MTLDHVHLLAGFLAPGNRWTFSVRRVHNQKAEALNDGIELVAQAAFFGISELFRLLDELFAHDGGDRYAEGVEILRPGPAMRRVDMGFV